ncbi:hypothetical protein AYI68_g1635 [Smittium mucronatum]|uniref:Uncharacterized protein n=1 Tax=Smittium mucronatum TaxID=133383 RepID=A0A1R0H4Q5_9FUNG|nr:hypothetical protein AYI68_g1635 [Smittium mucronatum]
MASRSTRIYHQVSIDLYRMRSMRIPEDKRIRVLKLASNYVILSAEDLIPESTICNSDIISCGNCGVSVGESLSNISVGTRRLEFGEAERVAKFPIHKLNFNLNDKESGENLNQYSTVYEDLGLVLIREMLTLISAHASYHYIIQNLESKKSVLLIWVVGWGVSKFNNYKKPNVLNGFTKGLKILFHDISAETPFNAE